MEKLIELLREYNRTKEGYKLGLLEYIITDGIKYEPGMKEKKEIVYRYEPEIISKKFGFIKWLVENDKIFPFEIDRKIINSGWLSHGEETTINRVWNNLDKVLLMLLAIQDEPINFLIQLLK